MSYSQQNINSGAFVGDPTADTTQSAFKKTQANFTALFNGLNTADVSVLANGTTVARLLTARFADFLNVLDFGADPTGVVDSTAAIQAAINATNIGVYFPPGVYLVGATAHLIVPSQVSLVAIPGTVTIKAAATATQNPLLIQFNTVSNCEIVGIIWDGNYPTVTNTNTVVLLTACSNVTFHECGFQNTAGIALFFGAGTSDSGGYDCWTIDTGDYGVQATGNQAVIFSDSIAGNSNRNFWLGGRGQNGASALLGLYHQNGFSCTNFRGTGTTNLSVVPRGPAIYATGCNGVLIENCLAENCTGNGIDCYSNTALVINGCVARNNGGAGIQSSQHIGGAISNNLCVNNYQSSSIGGPGGSGGWVYVNSSGSIVNLIWSGGITLGGTTGQVTNEVLIQGNTCLDTQVEPFLFANLTAAATNTTTLTVGSTTGLSAGSYVSGNNILPDTTVVSATGTTLVISQPTAGTLAVGTQLGFGPASPTQNYGIQALASVTLGGGVYIDQNNNFGQNSLSNVNGPFGGQLTGYSPFKISGTVPYMQQIGASPNQGIAMNILGTGYLSATQTYAPGVNAVDLQLVRNSSTQIAAGLTSFLVGGAYNVASATLSGVLGGNSNQATGIGSIVIGGQYGWDKGRQCVYVFPSYAENSGLIGKRQMGLCTLGASTAATTPVRMTTTTNTGTTNGANSLLMQSHETLNFVGVASAISVTTGDRAYWDNIKFKVYQGTAASTTVIDSSSGLGSPTSYAGGTGAASNWTITIAADTTNGAVNLTATGSGTLSVNFVLSGYFLDAG